MVSVIRHPAAWRDPFRWRWMATIVGSFVNIIPGFPADGMGPAPRRDDGFGEANVLSLTPAHHHSQPAAAVETRI